MSFFVQRDIKYMAQALELAKEAYNIGEVPIGALVVSSDDTVVGEGYNQTESMGCQDQHAEMCAIRQACKSLATWRLEGCTLYVTLEPCVMCLGCIVLSRIERLVYAAPSPLFGYSGDISEGCTGYAKKLHNITIGVQKAESEALLKDFFQKKRIKG